MSIQPQASKDSGHEIRVGDLFSFPEGHGWCKHGLLLAGDYWNGRIRLRDTYWGNYSGNETLWDPSEVAGKIEFIINLNDCRSSNKREYETYSEKDRAYIPIGGTSESYYVRKGAQPDRSLVLRQLENDLDDAEHKLNWAKQDVIRAQKALDDFNSANGGADD